MSRAEAAMRPRPRARNGPRQDEQPWGQLPDGGARLALRARCWWLNPIYIVPFAILPGLLLAWSLDPSVFAQWGVEKVFSSHDAYLGIACVVVFCIGGAVAGRAKDRVSEIRLSVDQVDLLETVFRWCFRLTVVGYVVWVLVGAVRGLRPAHFAAIAQLDAGAVPQLKAYLRPVAGVTTLTQLGPIAIATGAILARSGRITRRPLVVLLLLALVRSITYGERLALIEVLIPWIVVCAAIRPSGGIWRHRGDLSWNLAPVFAPVVLVALFATFEYNRSWVNFYSTRYDSYWDFVATRLGGYYVTAFNNSAILDQKLGPSLHLPYYTVNWAWEFPGVSAVASYQALNGIDPVTSWSAVLAGSANPEFNNTGGVLMPIIDWGVAGGLILWALLGFAICRLYRRFQSGDLGSLPLLAVVFVALLEGARLFYLGLGRAFPSLVAGLVVIVLFARASREDAVSVTEPARPSRSAR